jgi:hypothetical protein
LEDLRGYKMALKKKGIAQPLEVVQIEEDEKGKIKIKGKKKLDK